MREKIQNLYLEIIEKIAINSADCKSFIREENTDSLLIYLDQRTSLINIFKSLKIKLEVDAPMKDEFNKELNKFLKKMELFNQEILTYLENEKEKTKLQIAKTFKNKENLKGYNLSSTK